MVVDRPVGKPVITSKWVFKKKRGLTGKVEKYKARLVARGFMQEEGVGDVNEKERRQLGSAPPRWPQPGKC